MTAIGLDISQYLEADATDKWLLPIDHLSASSLAMLQRCPEQFRQRYVLGRKERPGEALIIGTAVHLAVEQNFSQKINTFEDLPLGLLEEWYDDIAFPTALEERVDEGEIVWDTDPDGARLRGRAITHAYHRQVAPRVQPLSVELRMEADFGIQVPVIGFADVETEATVIDVKTGKQSRRQVKPEWRTQAGVYSAIKNKPVDFHCVSASERTKAASVTTPLESSELSVFLPPDAVDALKHMVGVLAWMAQTFMSVLGPDEPWPTTGFTHPWACGYCGYIDGCPAWKGMR